MSWLFRSIKFNVILFLCIAVLAALGTLIPQSSDNSEKVAALLINHPGWGSLLNTWGLFDIYHTFLFAGLLGLMAFDVVVCKLWNKPPDPGLVPLAQDQNVEEISVKAMRKKPYRLGGVTSGSVAQVTKILSQRFKRQHFAVKRVALAGEGVALLASRHRLQRWGSYVSHISLVVILLGAMLKSLLGFETFLPILEGQSANVVEPLMSALHQNDIPSRQHPQTVADQINALTNWPNRAHNALQHYSLDPLTHWTLAVDKMTVDFYQNSTTPSTFASRVHLYDQDRALADTTIRVNQPLDVRHVRFYQASWGVTGMIRGSLLRVGNKTIQAGMKESFPVPGQPWTARVEHYLPDFVIGENGQPITASLEWKNPALIIGFYNKKKIRIGTLAVSAPSPAISPDMEPWGVFFFDGGHLSVKPPFHVLAVEPVLFSGIQVSYDPGFPIITAGVLSMLLGLMALFYLHQRRVLVFVRPGSEEDQVRIDIGGWSSRGEKEFAQEFQSFFRSLDLKTPSTS